MPDETGYGTYYDANVIWHTPVKPKVGWPNPERCFPGWRRIEFAETIMPGDVGVLTEGCVQVSMFPYLTVPNPHKKSVSPNIIGSSPEQVVSSGIFCHKTWELWRRSGPRQLPGNPHYSKPLPLP